MQIVSMTKVVRLVVVHGAIPGGVSSAPTEVTRTFPALPLPLGGAFEHPVLPDSTIGPSIVQPRRPLNSSNLLTAGPL